MLSLIPLEFIETNQCNDKQNMIIDKKNNRRNNGRKSPASANHLLASKISSLKI